VIDRDILPGQVQQAVQDQDYFRGIQGGATRSDEQGYVRVRDWKGSRRIT